MLEPSRAKHKRLAPVQNRREFRILIFRKRRQRYRKCSNGVGSDSLRHLLPAVVSHVVNIAITAIDVASACYFYEDGIDPHRSHRLSVMAIVNTILSS